MRSVKSALGSKVFAERLAVLRCGRDHALGLCASESAKNCDAALGAVPSIELVQVGDNNDPVPVLPFDFARAHELHKALLGTRHRSPNMSLPSVLLTLREIPYLAPENLACDLQHRQSWRTDYGRRWCCPDRFWSMISALIARIFLAGPRGQSPPAACFEFGERRALA